MPRQVRITEQAFVSYLDCTHKAFLQLHGQKGEPTKYEQHKASYDIQYRAAAIARLEAQCRQQEVLRQVSLTAPVATSDKRRLVIADHIVVAALKGGPIVLFREKPSSLYLEPVHFYRYAFIPPRETLPLAFKAVLIGRLTGVTPSRGQVIHGPTFERTCVSLATHIKKADAIIAKLIPLLTSKEEQLFLNYHCDSCEFMERCKARAEHEDNLSQLQGMRRADTEKQNRKGIFTVHQLSYTFRPRKTPKRAKNPAKPRHFALQAQAIRENMVYIHGTPELAMSFPRIYFDIEGTPENNSYYLIGALVETTAGLQYQSFWTDDTAEQSSMFVRFCKFVASFPNAALFHYGSYDIKALKDINSTAASAERELFLQVIASCHNVLSLMHSHCYLPLYSVRLRNMARFLGCELNSPIRSGAESIIFREQWETSQDDLLKVELISYNREDCMALKVVSDFLRSSVADAAKGSKVDGRNVRIALSESVRKVGEGNRPTFKKAEFALPDFDFANRCAYFDYQRERVYARTTRKAGARKHFPRTARRQSEGRDVVVRCSECPDCGGKRLVPVRGIKRQLIDLRYFETGIGVKRWQPRCTIWQYRCRLCKRTVVSPPAAFNAKSKSIYGYGLICWCVYHNVVAKQSMLQVERSLYDIFCLRLTYKHIYRFRPLLASYYLPLHKEILEEILKEDVIYIDETPVKLRKCTGYVWVLATVSKVHYVYRESREGAFPDDLLADFTGVLVSDFFTAYDSLKCRHQKCLVHLMRDINDDLRKHPFDADLLLIAEEFGGFLRSVVASIDRWGLKSHHLRKYAKQSDRLLRRITGGGFASDCAQKYQKRFSKYGKTLFTFLTHSGVSWNNNIAEHAIHYFAKLRRFTDGTFTQRSIDELLTIVGVLQTCEYNNVNPLRFLLSGKTILSSITQDRKG